jgi:hypothetical protein
MNSGRNYRVKLLAMYLNYDIVDLVSHKQGKLHKVLTSNTLQLETP